jgi:hypothetical protein
MSSRMDDVKVRFIVVLLLITFITATGCASAYKTVLQTPPDHYQKLGEANGKACGSTMILATFYNVIPAVELPFFNGNLNKRVENAYQNAIDSVPGATALLNVTMQENWFWWVLGSTKCVTITGEAIR